MRDGSAEGSAAAGDGGQAAVSLILDIDGTGSGSLLDSILPVVQPFSRVRLCATPWTAACQASLPYTVSWSLLKLMSFEAVMPSNHLVFCHPLLLLPSIFPSIRVFSSELAFRIRWLKYCSFSSTSTLVKMIQ